MAQPTVRARVYGYDNIATGQAYGKENAVAVSVPGPALPVENVALGFGPSPYGVEKIAVAVTGPNPERLG